MKHTGLIISLIFSFTFLSGKDFHFIKKEILPIEYSKEHKRTHKDTIIVSKIHNPHTLTGDFDEDKISDTVRIVQNTLNGKYGLEFIFGTGKNLIWEWVKKFSIKTLTILNGLEFLK